MVKSKPMVRWSLALVLVSSPSLAIAAEGGGLLDSVASVTGVVSLLAALLAAIATSVVLFFRWQRATSVEAELRRVAERQAGIVGSSPLEHIYWTISDDQEYVSRRFSVLFEGGVKSFAELADKFPAEDFEKLETAAEGLRNEGRSFAQTLRSTSGTTLNVTGAVVPGETGQPVAHVLWLDDISHERDDWAALRETASVNASAKLQLEALLNDLPFAVWLRKPDLTLAWVNRTYGRMVEVDAEQAVMGDGIELGAAAFAPAPRELAAEAQRSEETQRETRHIVVDGERRAFEITEMKVGAEGQVAGFARDATALEEARAELRRHVESHAETLDKLKTPAAIYGIDKHLKFSNHAFARLWQLDETWLESEPHHNEVLEAARDARRLPEQADFPAWKEQQMELYTQVLEPQEDVWHLPDGTTLRVVVQPHPLGGLLFFYEDMSDWLALERSLNTVLEVQGETLTNLHEAVSVFGGDGRLKLYNAAFAQIWQLDEQFLGAEPHINDLVESCRDLFDDQGDWPETKKGIVGVVTDRRATSGRFERPNDTVLEFSGVPLPDGAMLMIYLDVTDTAKIARALLERAEALETADRLKSEFIQKMSYELRTPLNTIIGFSEILSNEYFGDLNGQQREYSAGIFDASQQLLALVNDVLDLAMVESGALELDLAEVEISKLLDEVVKLVNDQVIKKELSLVIECPDDIGSLEGDDRRLKQILFNLLSNSIKFNVEGGQIILGASRRDESVALWVEDTGHGIKTDEQSRIFEKFETGREAHQYRGAGLGLSLVRSFVELHGGNVQLESKPDEGTRVTCNLPTSAKKAITARPLDEVEAV
jgi:signal transduction histidine kinase/PAS domain-containing protein